MKRITVIRHAEAGQAARDFERPLTEFGISQAKITSEKLKEFISPDLLLVSSAARTRETAIELIKVFDLDESKCRYETSIYEAGAHEIKELICSLPDSVNDVVLIGHNPTVSTLVTSWTGLYCGFPTAFAVVLECNSENWATVFYSDAKITAKVSSQN